MATTMATMSSSALKASHKWLTKYSDTEVPPVKEGVQRDLLQQQRVAGETVGTGKGREGTQLEGTSV